LRMQTCAPFMPSVLPSCPRTFSWPDAFMVNGCKGWLWSKGMSAKYMCRKWWGSRHMLFKVSPLISRHIATDL
jgi:hypothetical protein